MGTGTKGHRRPETALRGPALHNHLSSVPELAHTCRDPANWHAAPLRLRRISFPLSNQARNPSNRWTVNARIVKMRIAAEGSGDVQTQRCGLRDRTVAACCIA